MHDVGEQYDRDLTDWTAIEKLEGVLKAIRFIMIIYYLDSMQTRK